MDSTNIILWTFSFVFAISGITFGIIASYNSSRANKKIQELIYNSWINDESQKFFFTNIKNVIAINKKTIAFLNKKNKPLTYYDYSLIASPGRLIPIASKIQKMLNETEYKDILQNYSAIKKASDEKYQNIVKDFSILQTNNSIPKTKIKQLLDYHKNLVDKASIIIKKYQLLSSNKN